MGYLVHIIISASNEFIKWLGLDLERIPSIDSKCIGTQAIISNENTLSWQCQALRSHSRSKVATVIAVEATSRYCIIFPNLPAMSMAQFEQELTRRWLKEVLAMATDSGAILPENVSGMKNQFNNTSMTFSWFKNTDLSVNGHVSDTEQWIKHSNDTQRTGQLDEIKAFELGFHINSMKKKVKISKHKQLHERFVPVARLLDDALFRFAQGLSYDEYPNVDAGNFPNPYALYQKKKAEKLTTHLQREETVSNVVYLNQFKSNR